MQISGEIHSLDYIQSIYFTQEGFMIDKYKITDKVLAI